MKREIKKLLGKEYLIEYNEKGEITDIVEYDNIVKILTQVVGL